MVSTRKTDGPTSQEDLAVDQKMREMNEALLISSVRQHELAGQARKAELRYRGLFESAKDGILILDTDTGRISDANPFMSQLLGYPTRDFMGKELWELGRPSDKSSIQTALRELREKGHIHYENLVLETKQGRRIEVEIVGNVYKDEDQSAIQCNIRDITERRSAELTLAKALAYGDDIIATLREPFLVLDNELRVRTANRSFYDAFHVSKQQTENCFVYDLGNGQWDIPGLRALLDQVLTRNESVNDFEVEHCFPVLGQKTMVLNARPFPPDSQNPELILLAVYDVSAARARAEELAELHRRKDEFLAMLSHELRNPLAPILSAVQLLGLRKDEDELQRHAHAVIERQVVQLTRLVDDLLEVSRITTGRVRLHRERVVVNDIVENAIETTRPLLEQGQHELNVSMSTQPIWLDVDADRLEQVVVNLLANAAKYSNDGGHIWLTVGLEGHECVLRVRDAGVGIAPELLPCVFDLFTQAEQSLARSKGGLGIGLALVKRLTVLHGGKVEVNSALGEGSEFVVRLPVAAVRPTDAPRPRLSASETDQPTIRPLRILVVDDNQDLTEMLEMLLKELGHEVRTAHDGHPALEVALDFLPNVVLLDIGLPGMDGYELAKRIRRQPALTNVILVALTGYGQGINRQRSRDAGFDHYLVKPADFKMVQQILATVSEKAR